jgi:diguanylate cyclase (GGDEF)-like protein
VKVFAVPGKKGFDSGVQSLGGAVELDIRSLMWISSVLCILIGTLLLESTSRFVATLRLSIRMWASGTLILGLSWMLLANASRLPLSLGVSVGTCLLFLGAMFQGRAFRVFLGRPRHSMWLYTGLLIQALCLVFFLYIYPDYSLAFGTSTFIGSLLFCSIATELFTAKPIVKTHSVKVIGLIFATTALLLLSVSLCELFITHSSGLHDGTLHQRLLFGFGAVATMVASLSFMVMCSERYHEDLARKASTDPLTSVYNRRMLDELGHRLMAESVRHNHSCSALMIDIDHFKKINDSFGHATGDLVLKNAVDLICTSVRAEDIVGRIGGEEFVVLMPETSMSEALVVAERVCKNLRQSAMQHLGHSIKATVSIGVAQLQKGQNLNHLLEHADRALYQAKANGRNCVQQLGSKTEHDTHTLSATMAT